MVISLYFFGRDFSHPIKLIYLALKRAKPALGIAFPFVMIFGALFDLLSTQLFIIAIGFACLYLFMDIYNDFYDYHEDVKNNRVDKLLISTNLKREMVIPLSLVFCFIGLIILFSFSITLGIAGIICAFIGVAYSHPLIRLKKYDFFGYLVTAVFFLALLFSLAFFYSIPVFSPTILLLGLFFVFQYVYILSQKDSTDPEDDTNLFLKRKNLVACGLCILSAAIALLALLLLSLNSVLLLFIWLINSYLKVINLGAIAGRTVQRNSRFRNTTWEYITHHLYYLVYFVGGLL